MKKKVIIITITLFSVLMLATGCSKTGNVKTEPGNREPESTETLETAASENTKVVTLTPEITQLEEGLSAVKFDGDYGFDDYLSQGGASSDAEVIDFLTKKVFLREAGLELRGNGFGCSTLSVTSPEGDKLFGRNFDWKKCNAMVVSAKPKYGYSSISTVNMDFINISGGMKLAEMPSEIQAIAALYMPLDGMNERGFCISVNMIEDSDTIEQNTEKPDITTTTLIRLLLDKAANVEEALALLKKYDLHASMGMMVHFALTDTNGRSVVVEYIDNEMVVIDTHVVTNFYIHKGKKNGIGTAQSHTRYGILMKQLKQSPKMSIDEVRDALDSVSKDNFGEFESTEWSIIFNQSSKKVRFYHQENYGKSYVFTIE
jgi:predicted choloylglycine hydrolase